MSGDSPYVEMQARTAGASKAGSRIPVTPRTRRVCLPSHAPTNTDPHTGSFLLETRRRSFEWREALVETNATKLLQRIHYNLSLD
jgi:hypothetical protein